MQNKRCKNDVKNIYLPSARTEQEGNKIMSSSRVVVEDLPLTHFPSETISGRFPPTTCGNDLNFMSSLFSHSGFTLIELLVVVLIIGILAAVAVPQYQKAVLKSRFTQLLVATKALRDAEHRYKLANGVYTRDRDALDIEFAGSDERFPTAKSQLNIIKGKAHCGIEGTTYEGGGDDVSNNIYCDLDTAPKIGLMDYLNTGTRICCSDDPYANKLCRQELNSSAPQARCYYGKW